MIVMQYIVTAPAILVSLPGGAPGVSQAKFLEQGSVVPEGVEADAIEHLRSNGLIAEASDAPVEPEAPGGEAPGSNDGEVQAEQVDLSAMTVAQLRDFAAASSVDLGGARAKDEIIAAIQAASA